MTAAEYKATLARLSLNQREAGELLGVTKKTSEAWAQGARPVHPCAAMILHIADKRGLAYLRKLLA